MGSVGADDGYSINLPSAPNYRRFANITDVNMFIAEMDATIIDSLKKIGTNKKGRLIIENFKGKVAGALTDGDIRRA